MTNVGRRYQGYYSEEGFWIKARRFSRKAGREVVERALILYFTLQEPGTPAWAKAVIVGALGYFILPTDAVPDPIFVDDIGVIAAALAAVVLHVTDEARALAKKRVEEWFGEG